MDLFWSCRRWIDNIKWGEQNYPLVNRQYQRAVYQANALDWKERNADRVERNLIAWDGILLEEVFEALETEDEDKQVEELIHVAAVALQAIASIKRNKQNGRT